MSESCLEASRASLSAGCAVALLVLLSTATQASGEVIKIGAIFDKKPATAFAGRPWQNQFNGWASNQAAAAAAAVSRINSDNNILPDDQLRLVDIDVDAVRAAAWLQGGGSAAAGIARCFLQQFHESEASLLRESLFKQLDNLTALIGAGYR
jgi:hypothetical protein